MGKCEIINKREAREVSKKKIIRDRKREDIATKSERQKEL
jgi:hypothetical protein